MSAGPKFLTYKQILRLHEIQIEEFGGHPGVKDEGLVKSAIAQPFAGTGDEYFHKDMFEMAAAYLFHLVRNHAFHDGNKRIAALAASVFLEINSINVVAQEDEFEKIVLDAAQGLIGKNEIADFFRRNSRPS